MITSQLLANLFPYTPKTKRDRFIPALNKFLPKYGIDNARRVRAFLATCGIETDYFKTTTEYASGADYEGRRDLGNIRKGDGARFRGRGAIQTTGRFNYWRVTVRFVKKLTGQDFSDPLAFTNFDAYLKSANYDLLLREADRLGVNFLANPERLAEIETAIESACIFWEENNLNRYADKEDFAAVSGIVNRGDARKKALHYDKRLKLYKVCQKWIAADFSFSGAVSLISVQDPLDVSGDDGQGSQPTADTAENSGSADGSTTPPETAVSDPKPKLKDLADKYLKHAKNDSAKNIALVILGRIGAGISALFASGLTGKVFVIALGALVVGSIIYALIFYRQRLFGWIQTALDSLLGH